MYDSLFIRLRSQKPEENADYKSLILNYNVIHLASSLLASEFWLLVSKTRHALLNRIVPSGRALTFSY